MTSMEQVLIIGASGGIGAALSLEFAEKGYSVDEISRSVDGFDLTDARSVAKHLEDRGPYHRVVIATGALEISGISPEKTVKNLTTQAMVDQFTVNAVGPALVLRHAHTLLPRDKACVFAVLSARVGYIGDNRIGGWISYRSAKAALNQIVRTASIEIARSHRKAVLVALHPGTVATSFTEKYVDRHPTVPAKIAARNLIAVMDRLEVAETGGFFDYTGAQVPW
jgi:NAD(P)-dependent dehydrogenase (short-subunit alcohol dehydrogenase family)